MTGSHAEHVNDAARRVAELLGPALEERLQELHGPNWLDAVNARRVAEGFAPGGGLYDHRFCLALLGYESATEGWIDEDLRSLARGHHRGTQYGSGQYATRPWQEIAVTTKFLPGQTVELEYRAPLWAFSGGSLGMPPQRYKGIGLTIGLTVGLIVVTCLCCAVNIASSSP